MPSALQVLGWWSRPTAFLERCRIRYGPRFTLRMGPPGPFVVVSAPDEIRQVFLAPPDVLHFGPGGAKIQSLTGPRSVFTLDEDRALAQRKLLLPPMHGEALEQFSHVMARMAEAEVDSWPQGTVALHPRLHRLTLMVMERFIFGSDLRGRLALLRDYLTEMLDFALSPLSLAPIHSLPYGAQRLLRALPALGVARFLEQRTRALQLVAELIEDRRRSDSTHDGLLTLLLSTKHEDGSPLSLVELSDVIMDMYVAGVETTSSALAWVAERLAREPAVQSRVFDEMHDVPDDSYLTATVHEVLRLKPIIPTVVPRMVKEPIEIGGVLYRPGVSLFPCAHLLHRDPVIYPEPYNFRPERFLENPPNTYTWIPFGGGRRRCPGASLALVEMKIVLRAMLARWKLRRASGDVEAPRHRSVTITPIRGGRVVLTPRRPAEPTTA